MAYDTSRGCGPDASRMTDAPAETDVQPAQSQLALLTTGSRHAAGILDALERRGLTPDLVVIQQPRGQAMLGQVRTSLRRRGVRATAAAVMRALSARLRPSREPWRGAAFYASRARRVATVTALASDEAADVLRASRPKLVLLGGAPILPAAVLEVPSLGVLNAHPGLLPRYRGVDVVGRAVLDGGPVGATIHFVDAGIDTGRIVSRIEVPIAAGDSLDSLQQRVEAAGADGLADAAARLLRDGHIETETQAERHPLSRRLARHERREIRARLRAG